MTTTTILSDNGVSSGTAGIKTTGGNDGTLQLQTTTAGGAATTAMTIDTSQNVGIGTSSPSTRLDVRGGNGNGGISGSGGTWAAQVVMNQDSSGYGGLSVQTRYATSSTPVFEAAIGYNGSTAGYYPLYTVLGDGSHIWKRAGGGANPESARIDSSGNLLVGTTSVPANAGSGAGWITGNINGILRSRTGTNTYGGNGFSFYWASAAQLWVDNTNIGNISISSDYRIKQKIETQDKPAIGRVMQLRPVTYELQDYGALFKADGVAREGFIAHELQEVVPSAVEGEKDAEGQIQSLKLDALCSVLTKAIQEQQALITTLTERITALEAK